VIKYQLEITTEEKWRDTTINKELLLFCAQIFWPFVRRRKKREKKVDAINLLCAQREKLSFDGNDDTFEKNEQFVFLLFFSWQN